MGAAVTKTKRTVALIKEKDISCSHSSSRLTWQPHSVRDQPPGLLAALCSAIPRALLSFLWSKMAALAPTIATACQPVGSREDNVEGRLLLSKNRAQRLYTIVPLLCHGAEFGHMVTLGCKGVWEV